MKKTIRFSLIFAIAAAAVLTACGSAKSSSNEAYRPSYGQEAAVEASAAYDGGAMYEEDYEVAEEEAAVTEGYDSSAAEVALKGDKLVHSCRMQIQTLEYAASSQSIRDAVKKFDGIIESETETNDGYDWYDPYWYYEESQGKENERARMNLYLTCRIPTDSYESFLAEIADIGKVLSKTQNTENISRVYYDTETHIKALEIEEERLLAMLEKTETIEDMIAVEQRLTEVQSELNANRGWLAEMDTDINYSTVYVELREVREYSPGIADPDPSFGQRIANAFREGWSGFLSVLEGLVYVLIALLPLIAAGLVAFFIIRHVIKKKKARRLQAAGQLPPPESPQAPQGPTAKP